MSLAGLYSERSKRLVQLALLSCCEEAEHKSSCYMEPECNIEPKDSNNNDRYRTLQNAFDINNSSSFLPDVKYETSGYFLGNIENRNEINDSYRKTMRWLLNYDSDAVFSTFDDSDQDRTYSPSSSSSIDDELNEKEPKKRPYKMKGRQIEKNTDSRNDDLPSMEKMIAKTSTKEDEIEKDNVDGKENVEPLEENPRGDIDTIRKQKRTSKRNKKKILEEAKNKHLMLDRCNGKCRKKCSSFTEEIRKNIWDTFWSSEYTSRRKWMSKHVTLVPIKRRLLDAKRPRKDSRVFTLPLPDGRKEQVCRLTFLNTLGYKNDSVLTHLVASIKAAPCDKLVKERRGIHPKTYLEIDKTPIVEHINSFHPCVSHYRRKNAPNVKYLSRELSCQFMYKDFKENNPNVKCSLETYRKVIKDMNVSFYMPNSDKCDDCQTLENSISDAITEDSRNEAESKLRKHKEKAKDAEREYKKDGEKSSTTANIRFYSMDLQKVIILPIMPTSKSCFFTSRLIVFNETFATLKPDSNKNSYCVFWHEALGNRKAESIADAVFQIIKTERDAEEFVFWADNCSSQNKNYILYSFLVSLVNSPEGPKRITFKYLTKGHTHMTADGIHGNIEKRIKKKRNVYDFKDLVETAESARKGLKIILLEEFHAFKNKKRNTKKGDDPIKDFVLGNVVEASFEKGKFTINYKNDFNDDPKTIDLFQKKYISKLQTGPINVEKLPVSGISVSKKQNILRTLVPLMPENRRHFWFNLPESETSSDLTSTEQYEIEVKEFHRF